MEELVLAAKSRAKIQACFPAMKELRPHLIKDIFVEQVLRQQQQGNVLVYLQDQNQIGSVAGYRIQEFLAWGKILYSMI